MSLPEDHDLIDRHLAGILQPDEEARLEQLIRSSPTWARRYRDAEEMARLLGEAIGRGRAPLSARRSIRRAIESVDTPRPRLRLLGTLPRQKWLVAACLLVALSGTYLFFPRAFPGKNDGALPLVYANEPLPLKDLARMATVGVVGEIVKQDDMLGLYVDDVLFGNTEGMSFALPSDLRPGQRVALFGARRDDDVIELVGGRRGVVHLDGLQRWDGKNCRPEECTARVRRAASFRSLSAALADLRAFVNADTSLVVTHAPDGLPYSGAVTARFLGRFRIQHIRGDLMGLLQDLDKRPEARAAAGEALVAADATGACREILSAVLANKPHLLRAESEDGNVVLHCLDLMRVHGTPDLGAGLERLATLVECPAIQHAARSAAHAVTATGPRHVETMRGVVPVRVTRNGQEALVMSGCEGRHDGLLVVFRSAQTISSLRLPVNLAVGQGMGVLVLPAHAGNVDAWVRAAVQTGRVRDANVRFLGIGRAALDALQAAEQHAPEVVYLMAADAGPLAKAPATQVDTHIYGSHLNSQGRVGNRVFHPTSGQPKDWLGDEELFASVLATD